MIMQPEISSLAPPVSIEPRKERNAILTNPKTIAEDDQR
jgi:hypothetical protein